MTALPPSFKNHGTSIINMQSEIANPTVTLATIPAATPGRYCHTVNIHDPSLGKSSVFKKSTEILINDKHTVGFFARYCVEQLCPSVFLLPALNSNETYCEYLETGKAFRVRLRYGDNYETIIYVNRRPTDDIGDDVKEETINACVIDGRDSVLIPDDLMRNHILNGNEVDVWVKFDGPAWTDLVERTIVDEEISEDEEDISGERTILGLNRKMCVNESPAKKRTAILEVDPLTKNIITFGLVKYEEEKVASASKSRLKRLKKVGFTNHSSAESLETNKASSSEWNADSASKRKADSVSKQNRDSASKRKADSAPKRKANSASKRNGKKRRITQDKISQPPSEEVSTSVPVVAESDTPSGESNAGNEDTSTKSAHVENKRPESPEHLEDPPAKMQVEEKMSSEEELAVGRSDINSPSEKERNQKINDATTPSRHQTPDMLLWKGGREDTPMNRKRKSTPYPKKRLDKGTPTQKKSKDVNDVSAAASPAVKITDLSTDNFDGMTNAQLKEICRNNGTPVGGTKPMLVKRVKALLLKENDVEKKENDVEKKEEQKSEDHKKNNSNQKQQRQKKRGKKIKNVSMETGKTSASNEVTNEQQKAQTTISPGGTVSSTKKSTKRRKKRIKATTDKIE